MAGPRIIEAGSGATIDLSEPGKVKFNGVPGPQGDPGPPVADGDKGDVTVSGGGGTWEVRDSSDNVVIGGAPTNTYAGTRSNVMIGGGTPTSPNSMTGANELRTLIGGYDSTIGNAIASTMVGSQHSAIDDGSTHGTVVGGSYLALTDSDYSAAIGGTGNSVGQVGAQANYSACVGGQTNTVAEYHSACLAGATNTVGNGGQYAALLGGQTNITYGSWSAVAGGKGNAVGDAAAPSRGDYVGVSGGLDNIAGDTSSARFSALAGGRNNAVRSEYGAAVGGQNNTIIVGATHATVQGSRAVASVVGSQVRASGRFALDGDAQSVAAVMRRQTTDATATMLTADGAVESTANRFGIPSDSAWVFSALIVARRTDVNGESAGWKIEGVIASDAGTVAFVGTPTVTNLGAATTWTVAPEANDVSNLLRINVTGEVGKTINWVADVKVVQVTG